MPDMMTRPPVSALASRTWDVLVIGGGITGAGIMREAARAGLRVLLVEQHDFASGTSSRSSKLVHGGLHYLSRFQFGLVHDAARERERLICDGYGLVRQLDFLIPPIPGGSPPKWVTAIGLGTYDLLGGHPRRPRRLAPGPSTTCIPEITHLYSGAFSYTDAQVDDARLVLRVIQEGCTLGGYAVNYVATEHVLCGGDGTIVGVRLRDQLTGYFADVRGQVVVNATGPWADHLPGQVGARPRIRRVRGSHLIFPRSRLPVDRAIVARHPASGDPIYLIPWEGTTIVGSTNVEQPGSCDTEPAISREEAEYLLQGVNFLCPRLSLGWHDVVATYAGVRPIVDQATRASVKASRESAIWDDCGMVTVAGGKLTTFRLMAVETLRRIGHRLHLQERDQDPPALEELPIVPLDLPFHPEEATRLLARYGLAGTLTIADAPDAQRQYLPGSNVTQAELRWAVRGEAVHHLDDLLLRRVRIGMTLRHGGLLWVNEIRQIVQSELGWDNARWVFELERYRDIRHRHYGLLSIMDPAADCARQASR